MASPVDADRVATGFSTAATNWSVNTPFPPGGVDNNLFVVYLRGGAAATLNSISSTYSHVWTQLLADSSDATDETTYVYCCWAPTGNIGTIAPIWSTAIKGAAIVWRITGAANPATQLPQVSAVQIWSTANQGNAPAISPTGGSKDYLFLQCIGYGGTTATGVNPPSYTGGTLATIGTTGGSAATNCVISVGSTQQTTATFDPVAWTCPAATTGGSTFTIAIHPGGPFAQNIPVTGRGSAQAFGTVTTAKGVVAVIVAALATAQALGTPTVFVPGPPQTVTVNGLNPLTNLPAIVGEAVVGQATVGGGYVETRLRSPNVFVAQKAFPSGVVSTQQFGAVATAKGPVSRTVTGLGSAQAFGAVATAKGPVSRAVTGLGSAQQFGSLAFRVTLGSGGVLTAQAFGVPTLKAVFVRTVTGLGSAQGFGVVTPKTAVSRTVTGVASVQMFGAISVGGVSAVAVVGKTSAQAFGAVSTVVTGGGLQTRTVTGLVSAQLFGVPTTGIPVTLTVDFIGVPLSGPIPLTVNFTDLTTVGG